MRRLAIVAAVALAVAAPVARADVEDGVTAFRTADFPTALKELKLEAQKGNVVAHHFLGKMYGAGLGVPRDAKQAVAHYKAAAEAGLVYAQVELANALALGEGIEQDFVEAMKWLMLASEAGLESAKAQAQALGKFVDRVSLIEARTKAREWLASHKMIDINSYETTLAAPAETPTLPAEARP